MGKRPKRPINKVKKSQLLKEFDNFIRWKPNF